MEVLAGLDNVVLGKGPTGLGYRCFEGLNVWVWCFASLGLYHAPHTEVEGVQVLAIDRPNVLSQKLVTFILGHSCFFGGVGQSRVLLKDVIP
jgi:hypothetical protein